MHVNVHVNARMRTEIDVNMSEFDLNEFEYVLKSNLDRCEIDLSASIIGFQCPLILFYSF